MSRPPEKEAGRGISAVEQEARAKSKNEERAEHIKRANITAAIYAVQNQLATNEDEQNATEKKRRFREWLTIALLIGTVLAAGWGDVIFYRTMMDARDANRPEVWPVDLGKIDWAPRSDNPNFGEVVWTFHFVNYGKTIAQDLETPVKHLTVLGNSFPDEIDIEGNPVPLPPTKDNFISVLSGQITRAQYLQALATDEGITMNVTITYRDGYGTAYESKICAITLRTGALGYCPDSYMK